MYYLSEMKSPGAVKASYKSLEGIPINGFVVTFVPPSVSIDPQNFRRSEDDDLNDINHPGVLTRDAVLYQKYEGLKTQNPFFDNVYYTKLEDQSEFISGGGFLVPSGFGLGKYQYWMTGGNSLYTESVSLLEGDPLVPTDHDTFLLHWDLYAIEKVVEGNTVELRYSEVLPTDISFGIYNEENTFEETPFMKVKSLDTPDDNLSLIFSNGTSNKIYLGGFGIFY